MVKPNYPDFKCPPIEHDRTKKRTKNLGKAHYKPFKLSFGYRLLDGRYVMEDIEDVIKHEIGHLLTYKIYGGCQGHNKNFKALGKKYGFNGSSSFSMQWSDKYEQIKEIEDKQSKYIIICPSCDKRWYKNRQQEVTKKPENYICSCEHIGLKCIINN